MLKILWQIKNYHNCRIYNNKKISKLLFERHKITITTQHQIIISNLFKTISQSTLHNQSNRKQSPLSPINLKRTDETPQNRIRQHHRTIESHCTCEAHIWEALAQRRAEPRGGFDNLRAEAHSKREIGRRVRCECAPPIVNYTRIKFVHVYYPCLCCTQSINRPLKQHVILCIILNCVWIWFVSDR